MDLNYQNFTGQYNLPMQTLQNVGALTASLGPMAGGFGYAGGAPTTNTNYTPSGAMGGGLGSFNSGFNFPINPNLGTYQNTGPASFQNMNQGKFQNQPTIATLNNQPQLKAGIGGLYG